MKKLTAAECERMVSAARTVADVLEELDTLRETTAAEFQRLLSELAEPQEQVRELLEDAASAAEEYYDERSEKWQEGDTGSAYAEWRDNLRRLADETGEEIEPPEIPEVERPSWLDECLEAAFAEFEA